MDSTGHGTAHPRHLPPVAPRTATAPDAVGAYAADDVSARATAAAAATARVRLLTALRDPHRLAALRATGLLDGGRVDALDRVARLAAAALGAPLAQVNLVTDTAQIPAAACVQAPLDEADWRRPVPLTHSYCQHLVSLAGPLVVEDAPAHPLVRDSAATREAGIGAYLAVPLVTPDAQVLGSVCVVDFAPRDWGAADLAVLVDLAAVASTEIALRASGLAAHDETRAAVARTDRLQRLSDDLATSLTRGQVARLVVTQMVEGIGASGGGVLLRASDGALELLDLVGDGDGDEERRRVARLPADDPSPAGEAARSARPVFVESAEAWDARGYRRRAGGAHADGAASDARAWAALPLVLDDRVLGVLTLGFHEPRALDAGERAFLLAHARQCALALERARLFDAEREARAQAEEASRAKSDFLNVLSHELRSPANAILGHAQLLELGVHGPVTGAQAEALGRIGRSAHLMGALVNDLLNLSRIEQGRLVYDVRDVPVREALELVTGVMRPQVEAKRLALAIAPVPSALVARADPERLQQILINLLTNAIKFTEQGTLTLGAACDGRTVRITMQDTGIGIPPEKLASVFDRFVQVDLSLTRRAGGMGLGLSIARDLARGMDGELAVASTEGEGSVFTLTLPRAADLG
jgi:signal transduction histidine kinase